MYFVICSYEISINQIYSNLVLIDVLTGYVDVFFLVVSFLVIVLFVFLICFFLLVILFVVRVGLFVSCFVLMP